MFTTLVIDAGAALDPPLEAFLRAEKHRILRAASAAEAKAQAREGHPDLILLDIRLQGGGGLALLPELLMEHAAAGVIVLAVKPSVSEAVEAMKMGAADVLERPLDMKKLKRAINVQKALSKEH